MMLFVISTDMVSTSCLQVLVLTEKLQFVHAIVGKSGDSLERIDALLSPIHDAVVLYIILIFIISCSQVLVGID